MASKVIRKRVSRLIKQALWMVSPSLVLRLLPPSKNCFSVGIYAGRSPFDLAPAKHSQNPVLSRSDVTDAPVGTIADPFMICKGNEWFMFFEVLNQFNRKGEIALATSKDGIGWQYSRIVLSEPFHMSYPQVFEWQGEFFLLPETGRDQSVRLYRAERFPYDWTHVATLLEGQRIVDSSILRFRDHWWLFVDAGPSSHSPTLRLYFSEDLYGPWTEHPKSPLIEGNPVAARPGGRVVIVNGVPHRFAQKVYPVYGSEVRAFEIYDLSTETYSEEEVRGHHIIGPGVENWNRHGMHHIDAHQLQDGSWLACVDGCVRQGFDESLLAE